MAMKARTKPKTKSAFTKRTGRRDPVQYATTPKENVLATTFGRNTTAVLDGSTLNYEAGKVALSSRLSDAMQLMSGLCGLANLTTPEVMDLHDFAASTENGIKEISTLIRARSLEVLLREGKPLKEGSSTMIIELPNGKTKMAKIQREGLDPKKFEAHLRAKGIDPVRYMATEVTYRLKDDSAMRAVADGTFTADELMALEYEKSYALTRSKEKKGGDQ